MTGPLIAFSGSRTFTDRELVTHVVERLLLRYPGCHFRVGDAKRGLDRILLEEATRRHIPIDVQECWWPPEPATRKERWEAAHERNQRVVQDAALLVAFYGPGKKSPGTTDAISQAKRGGSVIYAYHEGHWSTFYPPEYVEAA